MIQLFPLTRDQIYPLPSEEQKTFDGQAIPCRISGTGGLARLVMNGRPVTTPGKLSFWFDEAIFTRLREKAKMDLQSQGLSKKSPTLTPFRQLVGNYMKHCFRSDLAICKNWTEDFDGYAILPLRPTDSLIAWAGKIRSQSYFDPKGRPIRIAPDVQAAHDLAEKSGISLLGGQQQYVVDIDYPKNVTLKSRIQGPYPF